MLLGPSDGRPVRRETPKPRGKVPFAAAFTMFGARKASEKSCALNAADIFARRDRLDIGDVAFCDVGEPEPRLDDGGEELVARLRTKRQCVASAV